MRGPMATASISWHWDGPERSTTRPLERTRTPQDAPREARQWVACCATVAALVAGQQGAPGSGPGEADQAAQYRFAVAVDAMFLLYAEVGPVLLM